VARSIETGSPLLLSAGTGTGKTLAYLVPCAIDARNGTIEHPRRTLVVTANNNLLEQIRSKDGPVVTAAFKTRIAIVKGIENYLCLDRLKRNEGNLPLYLSDEQIQGCRSVENWSVQTHTGDRAEIDIDDPTVWSRYSTGTNACAGKDCPQYQSCHVTENRTVAKRADIVVTNYAYLLSTLTRGSAKWLDSFHRIICDEAHHLPDEARERLGWEISPHGLRSATYYADATTKRELDQILRSETERWKRLVDNSQESGYRITQPGQIEFGALERILSRAVAQTDDRREGMKRPDIRRRIAQAAQELGDILVWLGDVQDCADPDMVYHITSGREPSIKASLLHPGPALRNVLWSRFRAPILCSATLSVGGKDPFNFIRRECGIRSDDGETFHVKSPFDYYRRTLTYTPRSGPTHNDPRYPSWCADQALDVIDLVSGPVLILCTSLAAVRTIGDVLQSTRDGVLVQGVDGRRDALIRRIRDGDARVLVGSASLGTGLDLPGLDAVVIDKIPFPQWGDPVIAALRDGMDQGAFLGGTYIPLAVMQWTQWFGRLMRRLTDRGIVATLDRRMVERNYRSRFAAAKPRTRLFRDRDSLELAWKKIQ
jgi:ATP-dependent DNA helicase DinG